MSNGSRPAVLLSDLMSGDGPHRDLADRFVSGRCIRCGAIVREVRRETTDRGLCEDCATTQVRVE